MSRPSTPILEVKELTKRFGGLTALDRVTLHFQAGQLHSIIGPNGAGKTTLFNLLTGIFPPTSGQILFKGEEITGLDSSDLFRRGMVRTFQISSIFPQLSVLKNVEIAAMGRHRNSGSPWGRLTLGRVAIQDMAMEYLGKLVMEDKKDQRAGLLTYGDKRRLEIAMGLVSEPEILLLDEPTAGMSPEESHQITQFLVDLSKERTILLVEHDMGLVMSISQRVTVLHRGAVLADGTPPEIQRDPEVRTVYLGGATP